MKIHQNGFSSRTGGFIRNTYVFFALVCQSRLDLGFLIDGSGSMRRTFIKIIDFVKTLISFFPISQSQTRIGLVVFSSKAYPAFPFNRYNSKASVVRAVDRVRFPYGGTRTGNALRFTSGYVFCVNDTVIFLFIIFLYIITSSVIHAIKRLLCKVECFIAISTTDKNHVKKSQHMKKYDNFTRVFETANKLLTRHLLYLAP